MTKDFFAASVPLTSCFSEFLSVLTRWFYIKFFFVVLHGTRQSQYRTLESKCVHLFTKSLIKIFHMKKRIIH